MKNRLYEIPGCGYKILVTSICPVCGMLSGQVGKENEIQKGDLPVIKYRRHHVRVDDEDLIDTPVEMCSTCADTKQIQPAV